MTVGLHPLFCIVLNLECWTKTEDVHGLHGSLSGYYTPGECAHACKFDMSGCVAFDYNPSIAGHGRCALLTSTKTVPAEEKGKITHYEHKPNCTDEEDRNHEQTRRALEKWLDEEDKRRKQRKREMQRRKLSKKE